VRQAFAILQQAIDEGEIPGAVALVAHSGEVTACEAMGMAHPGEGRPMRLETLFDLASLTKVVATLPAILLLVEEGAVRLDDPVSFYLPSFSSADVRIRHLLAHTSGLPASAPVSAFEEAVAIAPQHPPGSLVLYSDLGFILLGMVVEAVTGDGLHRFFQRRVAGPCGMTDSVFLPLPEEAEQAAATEYRERLGRHQCGEVHDENASRLGGVAGHAGLFGTAADLWRYAQAWLYGRPHLLSQASVAAATRCHTEGLGDRRGLGWLLGGQEGLSCGDLFAAGAYGHTGFTGTSLWIDPEQDLTVILLTNRVYYGRHDHILRLRPRFHNAVAASLG
jgi:CubicO group peptidase (beta-lactamase class C family)